MSLPRILPLLLICFGLTLAPPSSAPAAPMPAMSFTGNPDNQSGGGGTNNTRGWAFIPNVAIEVSSLGLWDRNSDGLVDAHNVAIWNSLGGLVVQGTVAAGLVAPLQNRFRYVDVAATVLLAGESYTIGVHYPTSGDFASQTSPLNVSFDPALTFAGSRFGAGGFVRPTTVTGFSQAGPNFLFTAVPEPAAAWLLAAGALGMLASRRRARSS